MSRTNYLGEATLALVFLLGLFVGAGCVDSGGIPLADVAAAPESNVVTAYFTSGGFSFAAPTNTTIKRTTVYNANQVNGNTGGALPQACFRDTQAGTADGSGCRKTWGTITFPEAAEFRSDFTVALWLSSPNRAVVNAIKVSFMDFATTSLPFASATFQSSEALPARDASGTAVGVIDTTARVFYLGGGLVPPHTKAFAIKAGQKVKVEIMAWGVGASNTAQELPVDLRLEYEAVSRPSGIQFTLANPVTADPPTGTAQRVYLANNALSLDAPTATADLARRSANTGANVNSATEWSWGKITLPSEIASSGIAHATVWIQPSEPVRTALEMGVVASLYRGTTKAASGFVGFSISAVTAQASHSSPFTPPSPMKIVVPIPAKGVTFAAGSVLELRFQVFGVTHDSASNFDVLYGSAKHPSLVLLPGGAAAAPAAPPPPPPPKPESFRLTSSVTSIQATAGGNASALLNLTNQATTDAEFVTNVSKLPDGFLVGVDPALGLLPAGRSAELIFRVDVPKNASAATHNVTVSVRGPNGGTAQVTFVLRVEPAPSEPEATPTPEPSPSSTAAPSNETAGPRAISPSEEAEVPGPSPLILLGLLVAAAAASRRRR